MRCNYTKYSDEIAIENIGYFFVLSHLRLYLRRSSFDVMLRPHIHTLRIEWDRMWCDIIMAIMDGSVCATETNSWYSIKINRWNENQPNKMRRHFEPKIDFYLNKTTTTGVKKFQMQCGDEDFYIQCLSIQHIISFGTKFLQILKFETQRLWEKRIARLLF